MTGVAPDRDERNVDGRRGDAGPSRFSEALAVPGRLGLPARLAVPERLELDRVLDLPDRLAVPGPLRVPEPWLTPVDSPVATPGPEAPPRATATPSAGGPQDGPAGPVPNLPGRSDPDPQADEAGRDDDGPEEEGVLPGPRVRRGRGVPRRLLLLPALFLLIPILDNDDEKPRTEPVADPAPVVSEPPKPPPADQPAGGQAATGGRAVGMPIPTGTAPVRPVRIVLNTSGTALPGRERRVLARWIDDTQHSRTRVRILSDGRLTAPLDDTRLASPNAVKVTTNGSARSWLREGARVGTPGALLRLGSRPASRFPGPRLRIAKIPLGGPGRQVKRAIAAKIARQIMVTSRQGFGGTTTP